MPNAACVNEFHSVLAKAFENWHFMRYASHCKIHRVDLYRIVCMHLCVFPVGIVVGGGDDG